MSNPSSHHQPGWLYSTSLANNNSSHITKHDNHVLFDSDEDDDDDHDQIEVVVPSSWTPFSREITQRRAEILQPSTTSTTNSTSSNSNTNNKRLSVESGNSFRISSNSTTNVDSAEPLSRSSQENESSINSTAFSTPLHDQVSTAKFTLHSSPPPHITTIRTAATTSPPSSSTHPQTAVASTRSVGNTSPARSIHSVISFKDIVMERSTSIYSNNNHIETAFKSPPQSPSSRQEGFWQDTAALQRELHFAAEIGQYLLDQNLELEKALAETRKEREWLTSLLAKMEKQVAGLTSTTTPTTPDHAGFSPKSVRKSTSKQSLIGASASTIDVEIWASRYETLKRDHERLERDLHVKSRRLNLSQAESEALKVEVDALTSELMDLQKDHQRVQDDLLALRDLHRAEIDSIRRTIAAEIAPDTKLTGMIRQISELQNELYSAQHQLKQYHLLYGDLPAIPPRIKTPTSPQSPRTSKLRKPASSTSLGDADTTSVLNRRVTFSAVHDSSDTAVAPTTSSSHTPITSTSTHHHHHTHHHHDTTPQRKPSTLSIGGPTPTSVTHPATTATPVTPHAFSSLYVTTGGASALESLSAMPTTSAVISTSSFTHPSSISSTHISSTLPISTTTTTSSRDITETRTPTPTAMPSASSSSSSTTPPPPLPTSTTHPPSTPASSTPISASHSYPGRPLATTANIGTIVRLMVGSWLLKYNKRRTKCEKRFVNVNPYTRTLSWSKRDPADSQNTEVNTVYIQSVQVEDLTDGRSRFVIHSPLRDVVLECNSAAEHEIWERGLTLILQNQTKASDYVQSPQ